MTRRCSHCNHNGHNSRTCPNRGLMLFGVRLTEGSIRKSVSMGNLSHGHGSGSPGDHVPDHVTGDGYTSEGFVAGSSSSRERKKGAPWTEEEHRMFLLGLEKLGKGDWRGISRKYVMTRTPTQVASHAQKHFIRLSNVSRRKRRSSLFDMIPHEGGDIQMDLQEPKAENTLVETKVQSVHSIHQTESESMDSTNSTIKEPTLTIQPQPQRLSSYSVLYPGHFSPYYPFPLPIWSARGGYVSEPTKKEESHEILRPTAVHSKAPMNVDELFGMTKLSLGEPKKNGESDQSLLLNLGGGPLQTRQSAFHPNASPDSSDITNVIHAV
ncbi:hypothetical protein N665_0313s0020 [Sinapis alba]|nr:hypothetical protein N665_0313s0020 [Sinapis alba]